jgi:hypothetical protein
MGSGSVEILNFTILPDGESPVVRTCEDLGLGLIALITGSGISTTISTIDRGKYPNDEMDAYPQDHVFATKTSAFSF